MSNIELLDCTLRDGAYITDSNFGTSAMKGIILHMQNANVDIIECGWLKDKPHKEGSSYYHIPSDLCDYLTEKNPNSMYVAMIDWDRYDDSFLPPCDGKSLDAIRVVFPRGKHLGGIEIGNRIKAKGYTVMYQAANTLAYTNEELVSLAEAINKAMPSSLSIVDTFGAMYDEDLARIAKVLNDCLDPQIKLGFHSHNNQQLSFSLSIQFVEMSRQWKRDIIVDASLCGMGRGAGNTTTELMASYLNRKCHANYDMNQILDAIDMYMGQFQQQYKWGYSTPYFISGMYCTHVNNIAYLLNNHRTNATDMRNIIESLPPADRLKYDYDLLEEKYLDYQNKIVDDAAVLEILKNKFHGRKILLVASGKSIVIEKDKIDAFIQKERPVVIGLNYVHEDYPYDYAFFSNKVRYQYALETMGDAFPKVRKIITSNVKTAPSENEQIVNINFLVKRGWRHFDNSMITCLRLMNVLHLKDVALAGFDGFSKIYEDSYADPNLPSLNVENKWDDLNVEIKDMFNDFMASVNGHMDITFLTKSIYAG